MAASIAFAGVSGKSLHKKREHCKNSAPGSFAAIQLLTCSLLVLDNFVPASHPYFSPSLAKILSHPGLLPDLVAHILRPGGVLALNPEVIPAFILKVSLSRPERIPSLLPEVVLLNFP